MANRTILEHLVDAGVLKSEGGSIDNMVTSDLGVIFMPTGLGHLIGLDTHDVGGYVEGTPLRSDRPGLCKL
jgi:Xaa-Pro dipeptidase